VETLASYDLVGGLIDFVVLDFTLVLNQSCENIYNASVSIQYQVLF